MQAVVSQVTFLQFAEEEDSCGFFSAFRDATSAMKVCRAQRMILLPVTEGAVFTKCSEEHREGKVAVFSGACFVAFCMFRLEQHERCDANLIFGGSGPRIFFGNWPSLRP